MQVQEKRIIYEFIIAITLLAIMTIIMRGFYFTKIFFVPISLAVLAAAGISIIISWMLFLRENYKGINPAFDSILIRRMSIGFIIAAIILPYIDSLMSS